VRIALPVTPLASSVNRFVNNFKSFAHQGEPIRWRTRSTSTVAVPLCAPPTVVGQPLRLAN